MPTRPFQLADRLAAHRLYLREVCRDCAIVARLILGTAGVFGALSALHLRFGRDDARGIMQTAWRVTWYHPRPHGQVCKLIVLAARLAGDCPDLSAAQVARLIERHARFHTALHPTPCPRKLYG